MDNSVFITQSKLTVPRVYESLKFYCRVCIAVVSVCKYKFEEWSECDIATNTMTRRQIFKSGPSTCQQVKEYSRKCKVRKYTTFILFFKFLKSCVSTSKQPFLNFTPLSEQFHQRQIADIFLIFPRKSAMIFHANCLQETICMKYHSLFPVKNKKKYFKM